MMMIIIIIIIMKYTVAAMDGVGGLDLHRNLVRPQSWPGRTGARKLTDLTLTDV